MKVKHSVMVGLMGRQADRFHEYQPARELPERLEMARRVQGADGIEVVYPQDFTHLEQSVSQVKACGLPVSAVNLNVKTARKWQAGSFTSASPAIRADAVADLKVAMDLAAELGTGMVTCCPLIDGHNYSFQVDYARQWAWLEEGIAEGSLKPMDAQATATAIVSMAIGLLLQGILDPHNADWQKLAEQSMQLLMNGLTKT